METTKQGFFKETQQLAEEYIRERLLLLKLQTAEKVANLSAVIFSVVLIGLFLFIILLLITAMGCYFFEQVTGSWYYGIGLVILFYLIIVGFLIYFRKALFYKLVSNSVIKMFFEETDDIDETPQV